jgi:DNA-binding PadR family transcriptional regulator
MSASSDTPGLDRLIHEPSRLALLTVLSSTEDAGLVTVAKTFVGKKPNTSISLTDVGRTRIRDHWKRLDQLKSLAIPPEGKSTHHSRGA